MPKSAPSRAMAMPLGMQLLGLFIGALIVAQLVTLALTILLPPAPSPRWDLDRVAASLAGQALDARLDRREMSGPPDISAPGWLVSESSREALARRLHRPTGSVVLAFYTQLPVGGVAVPISGNGSRLGHATSSTGLTDWLITPAHAQVGPPPGPGFPGGAFPGSSFPGGGMPGGPVGGPIGGPSVGPPGHGAEVPSASRGVPWPAGAGAPISRVPPITAPVATPVPIMIPGPLSTPPLFAPQTVQKKQVESRDPAAAQASGATAAPAAEVPTATGNLAGANAPIPTAAVGAAAPLPAGRLDSKERPQPIPFRTDQGIRSWTTPPFIEGDFIAAVRRDDGHWMAVAPREEQFPNRWQRRVMLWFAGSMLIAAPILWWFSRRIVKPLRNFALAAEALGRDPATHGMPLSGPAEVGRAAHAFNQMRHRIRAFVEDRTAMIGAISHDLRTPLTRLRFLLEDVPDDQRDDLLAEVTEMEVMINQVIGFIRDASTTGQREQVNLASLVEQVVDKARRTGSDVKMDDGEALLVEVDAVGVRRLLTNMLENAVKYGERARVFLRRDGDSAVVEIIDNGPGIPDADRERVFEPFFRGDEARIAGKPGSGLGLAVCQSIARSHGGQIDFAHVAEGFAARLSLPMINHAWQGVA